MEDRIGQDWRHGEDRRALEQSGGVPAHSNSESFREAALRARKILSCFLIKGCERYADLDCVELRVSFFSDERARRRTILSRYGEHRLSEAGRSSAFAA